MRRTQDSYLATWDNATLRKIVLRVMLIFIGFSLLLMFDMFSQAGTVNKCVDHPKDHIKVDYSLEYTGWFYILLTKVKIHDMTFSNWYFSDANQQLDCKIVPDCLQEGECAFPTYFEWNIPLPSLPVYGTMNVCREMYTTEHKVYKWKVRETCANDFHNIKEFYPSFLEEGHHLRVITKYEEVMHEIEGIWKKGESDNKLNRPIMLLLYKCAIQVLYIIQPAFWGILLGVGVNRWMLKPLWEREHID